MSKKKLVEKALQAAMEARAERYVADPAERAANLAKWQAQTPAQITEPTWYHGTFTDVENLRPGRADATFVTTNPEFANRFATPADKGPSADWDAINKVWVSRESLPSAPNVMPLHVRAENPFDYENPQHIEALKKQFQPDPNDFYAQHYVWQSSMGDWSAIENPAIQKVIRDLGHDSFYVMEDGSKNLAVYDPTRQLKSATGNTGLFDPNIPRIDENRGGAVEREHHSRGERVSKALRAAMEARAKRYVADPAKRAENLVKFMQGNHPDVPEAVFHSSKADVQSFDPQFKTELSPFGFHFGTSDQANFRTGQYDFDSNMPNVGKYHLSLKNPLEVTHMGSYAPDHLAEQMMDMGILKPERYDALADNHMYDPVPLGNDLVKILKQNGYDGLMYKNEKEGPGFSFVPFDGPQSKSATGNLGTFDPTSPRLDENRGGAVEREHHADGGPVEYLSTGEKLIGDEGKINWGDPNEARDFFRADAEMMRRRRAEEEATRKIDREAITVSSLPAPGSEEQPSASVPIGAARQSDISPYAVLPLIRQAESSDDPLAQSRTSTAGGLYQFTDETWAGALRRMDPERYGRMTTAQLAALKKGTASIPIQEQAARFHLEKDILPTLEGAKIPVNPATIYLSWFQGPQGAVTAYNAPGSAMVKDLFPKTVGPNERLQYRGKPYAEWTRDDLVNWANETITRRMRGRAEGGSIEEREGHSGGKRVVDKAMKAVSDLLATPEMARWREGSAIPSSSMGDRYFTGTSKDTDFSAFKVGRHGAWFTKDPAEASSYAKENDSKGYKLDGWKTIPVNTADRVIPAFLRAENPFTGSLPEEVKGENYKRLQSQWFDTLRQQGYDAWMPESAPNLAVILKEPSQIKSAISNTGDFDPAQSRIDRADGGEVESKTLTEAMLGANPELPRGELTMSAPPETSLVQRALHALPSFGSYGRAIGEELNAPRRALDVARQINAQSEGIDPDAAKLAALGALGYAISPITAAQNVLIRDPLLKAGAPMDMAQRGVNVSDALGLAGAIKAGAKKAVKKGITESSALGSGVGTQAQLLGGGYLTSPGLPEDRDGKAVGGLARSGIEKALELAKEATGIEPATFIGERAFMGKALKKQLEKAQRRLEAGEDPSRVRRLHGWSPDPQGVMTYEMSDKDAKFRPEGLEKFRKGETVTLGELLDHPSLFDAYPQSFSRPVESLNPSRVGDKLYGQYDDMRDIFGARRDLDEKKLMDTLLHEHQHRIQSIEGMSPGQNTAMFKGPDVYGLQDQADKMLNTIMLYRWVKEKAPDLDWYEGRKKFVELAYDGKKDTSVMPLDITAFQELQSGKLQADELQKRFNDTLEEIGRRNRETPSQYEQYYRSLGEVTARKPGERIDMGVLERRRSEPITPEDQVILRPPMSHPRPNEQNLDWDIFKNAMEHAAETRDGFDRGGKKVAKNIREFISKLEDKPSTVKLPGGKEVEAKPIPEIEKAAEEYMQSVGRPGEQKVDQFVSLNPTFASAVARAFEEMKHNPKDPEVRRAYDALIDETLAQYRALKDAGIDFRFLREGQVDPYAKSPALGYEDIKNTGRLFVFPTEQGFGSSGGLIADNPLLKRVGRVGDMPNAMANDAFRVVHDAYGHFGPGNPFFRAPGEERAYQLHSRMYSPEALPAMTSETRGQNAWVNFGPFGERNRTASGAETVYADQKIGRLPEFTMRSPDDPNVVDEALRFLREREGRDKGGKTVAKKIKEATKKALNAQVR